jgi:biotin--protein ligase
VVPGGRDIPYVEDISALAVKKIQRYVREQGGSYLGICAGAYFAAKRIEFDKDGPLRVVGARPLGFLNGVAVGPIGQFVYDSNAGATTQCISTSAGQKLDAYCNGGCWFEIEGGGETLALYTDMKKPAVLSINEGRGRVVLMGVHLEFSSEGLHPIADQLPFDFDSLTRSDRSRAELWRGCLTSLGLALQAPGGLVAEETPTPFRLYGFAPKLATAVQPLFPASLPGTEVASSLSDSTTDMTFAPAQFDALLGDCPLGRPMIYAERIMSTQTLLRENTALLDALPDGTICLAGDQLAGKGRGSNTWLSSTGCLQFTLVKEHRLDSGSLPIMQYLVATTMCEAVAKHAGGSPVDVRIKWPNDIYARCKGDQNYRKAGGILVNAVQSDRSVFRLLIGFGINVYDTPWTVSLNDVMASHGLPALCKEQLLATFMRTFDQLYGRMEALSGTFPFDLYYKHWLHTNETVWLEEEQVKARIEGIDKDGFLVAIPIVEGLQTILYEGRYSGPSRILLQPDGNSFDLMRKLISIKR